MFSKKCPEPIRLRLPGRQTVWATRWCRSATDHHPAPSTEQHARVAHDVGGVAGGFRAGGVADGFAAREGAEAAETPGGEEGKPEESSE